MKYAFFAYGHQNVLGTHKTTLEFTKDSDLSLKGDCIIGVKADFDLKKIKELIQNAKNKTITISIETVSAPEKINETVTAQINFGFDSNREIVIRKTDFLSQRTLAVMTDKAANDLDRKFIDYLKNSGSKVKVTIVF